MRQVLAMGTKQIPNFSGELSTMWDAPDTAGASGGGQGGGQGELDVHMGEDGPRRGDREDDD